MTLNCVCGGHVCVCGHVGVNVVDLQPVQSVPRLYSTVAGTRSSNSITLKRIKWVYKIDGLIDESQKIYILVTLKMYA